MSFGGRGSDAYRDHFSLPPAEHAVHKKENVQLRSIPIYIYYYSGSALKLMLARLLVTVAL